MANSERRNMTAIAIRLEAAVEQLNKAVAPLGTVERIGIICEQIAAIRVIVGELKDGATNG